MEETLNICLQQDGKMILLILLYLIISNLLKYFFKVISKINIIN